MEMMRNAYKILMGKPIWKSPLEDLRLARTIILKFLLNWRDSEKCITLSRDVVQ
jgi:hypothetical protein